MRTKYKLTIQIGDIRIDNPIILFESTYHLTEECVQNLLKEAERDWNVDDFVLEKLVEEELYQGTNENGEAIYSGALIEEPEEYIEKYPEFVVAAEISQRVYGLSSFHELECFFNKEDLIKEENSIDLTTQMCWTVRPVD